MTSTIDRRLFLKATAASVALGPCGDLFAQTGPTKPNVLFIFTDDQNPDTIAALGNSHIRTPNIDRLIKMGTTFTNAYIMGGSSPAVCSPSRACLMTGRTLWNVENQGMWGFEISKKFKTLPEAFREAGYDTFGTGKNEPGLKGGSFKRGFTHGDKILFAGNSPHFRLRLHKQQPDGTYEREVIKGTHSSEVFADAAIDFMKGQAKRNKPFFAYVSFTAPHDPRQAPPEYRAKYPDQKIPVPKSFMPRHPFDNGMLKIRDERLAPFPRKPEVIQKQTAAYFAMITHMDAQIGRMLDALEKTGQLDNTIIVFTSDNGLAMGRHGLMGKQNVYEHSVHVPFVIAGPGVPRDQKRDQLCYIYDVYPTLCEMAGIKTPGTVQFKSFAPMLKDASAKHREHLYFAFMSWQRSVRDSRYKLIEYCVEGKRHTQLFDLTNDSDERTNLAGDPKHASDLARLRKLLKAERVRLNDGNTPYEFTDRQGKEFWTTYESTDQTTIQ
jgi:arylsulfatase A-like enzyme